MQDEAAELRSRLEETEETLRAIRQHMVDAFVVAHENGLQVVTLAEEGSFPYRLMVESMNEGAVTVIPDGTIFYCNPRFTSMVQKSLQDLIGVPFRELLVPEDRQNFEDMLREAGREGVRGEFCVKVADGNCVPVQLSFYQLGSDGTRGLAIIATDISERKQSEEKIRSLASALAIAEQEERHRISQVLHDDLQQRLFAIRAQLSFMNVSFEPDKIPPEMKSALDQIQGWLSEAISMTRNLSVDISPSVLQGEGIGEAIHWLAARMKEQYGLQLDVNIKDDLPQLPAHMRVTLFQAVRESLFNVVKHSGILQASVTIEKMDAHGRITIDDAGQGFDAKTIMADAHATHGLMIIRDRLKLMSGSLHVGSVPGDGTRVTIEFPIEGSLS